MEMFKNTSDLFDNEIKLVLTRTCDANPEKEWVPAYYFDICDLAGTKIGHCDLRIGYNQKTYIGGIGYGINEEFRGHSYASKACKLLFKLAKKHNMDYLYITCIPENIASSKTCQKAGGKFIEIADIPETNEMYQIGDRKVMVYKFDLI